MGSSSIVSQHPQAEIINPTQSDLKRAGIQAMAQTFPLTPISDQQITFLCSGRCDRSGHENARAVLKPTRSGSTDLVTCTNGKNGVCNTLIIANGRSGDIGCKAEGRNYQTFAAQLNSLPTLQAMQTLANDGRPVEQLGIVSPFTSDGKPGHMVFTPAQ